MAYVVTEACIKCKYTDCADVCPVTCFYEGENMLVINPSECIDCCACESECPVHAIYADHDVPQNQTPYIEMNAVLSGAKPAEDADTAGWPEQIAAAVQSGSFTAWPNIPKKKDPLPEAEEFSKTENKGPLMSPNPGAGD